MRAVIPVAGFGSRLRPHTFSKPKVLLNVAGKPMISYILDELKAQGVSKATIITGYKGEMVEDYITKFYPELETDFVEQTELLGLGHAIWCGRETYHGDELMMVLGDTIFDADLSLAFKGGKSSLGVKEVDDPRRFGVVVKNDDGSIKELVEKPENPISNLAIVGIYYIKNGDLLSECLTELIDKEIKTRGEYQLTDALQMMIDKGEEFTTFPVDGWLDCGKKETMLSTNQFLLKKFSKNCSVEGSVIIQPSFVADNAVVEGSIIGPYATISDGAEIKNSIIRNTIIDNNAKINNVHLENSLVGFNAMVEGSFNDLNIGDNSELTI